jgi:hypothetical protein
MNIDVEYDFRFDVVSNVVSHHVAMSNYPLPDAVTSPRLQWHLTKVLFRGDATDPSKHDPHGYSIAVGKWGDGDNKKPCLAIRWNCNEERPVGNPQSRGLPTWFIIPKEIEAAILSTLPAEAKDLARGILS